MTIEGYELDGPDATEGVVPARKFRRQRKGWRHWQVHHLARDGRMVLSNEWRALREEIAQRRERRLNETVAPAQVAHFRALDRVRVKEIEQLKQESAEAIAGLTNELRASNDEIERLRARLARMEAIARELEEGNRYLNSMLLQRPVFGKGEKGEKAGRKGGEKWEDPLCNEEKSV